jgi:hypothetical protein
MSIPTPLFRLVPFIARSRFDSVYLTTIAPALAWRPSRVYPYYSIRLPLSNFRPVQARRVS